MAKPPEKKPAPSTPPPLRVLAMDLKIGDRLSDETGEWEVIGSHHQVVVSSGTFLTRRVK